MRRVRPGLLGASAPRALVTSLGSLGLASLGLTSLGLTSLGLAISTRVAAAPPRLHPEAGTPQPLPSKAALFGDPTLVPSREGERARRELALAAALEEHIAEDPQIAEVHAHVSLAPHSDVDARAQVLLTLTLQQPTTSARVAALERRVERLGRAIAGDPRAVVTVDPIIPPTEPGEEAPRDHLRTPLALALLALGASAGIAGERLLRRRSRARHSPSRGS